MHAVEQGQENRAEVLRIIERHSSQGGITCPAIAMQAGLSLRTVRRQVSRLLESGQIHVCALRKAPRIGGLPAQLYAVGPAPKRAKPIRRPTQQVIRNGSSNSETREKILRALWEYADRGISCPDIVRHAEVSATAARDHLLKMLDAEEAHICGYGPAPDGGWFPQLYAPGPAPKGLHLVKPRPKRGSKANAVSRPDPQTMPTPSHKKIKHHPVMAAFYGLGR